MSSLQSRCDFMVNVARHALIMGITLDEFQKLAIAAYGVLESPAPETRAATEKSVLGPCFTGPYGGDCTLCGHSYDAHGDHRRECPAPEKGVHPDLRLDAKPHCRKCGGPHWVGAHDTQLSQRERDE